MTKFLVDINARIRDRSFETAQIRTQPFLSKKCTSSPRGWEPWIGCPLLSYRLNGAGQTDFRGQQSRNRRRLFKHV